MVCLDTSAIIAMLEGDQKVKDALVSAYSSPLTTTSITEYELLKHSNLIKRDVAERILVEFEIYHFGRRAAHESAKIFESLRAKGKMINENDILIAGIARANNDLLITKDRGFKNIDSDMIMIL